MGIPGFFQQIEKNHPEFIHASPPTNIDILTWDFNAILYNAFHLTSKFHNPSQYDLFAEKLLQNVEESMNRILKDYQPTQSLYIALDGVVPEQKMAEQRIRRSARFLTRSWWSFLQENAPISQKSNLPYTPDLPSKNKNKTSREFTTLEFTPGSQFYVVLHKFMLGYCQNLKTTLPNVSIIYDSPFTPGEAEQKILQWISQTIPNSADAPNIYLISKDGDLLVLPYALRPRNIYILREMEERFESHLGEVWGISLSNLPEFMVIDLPRMYNFYIEDVRSQLMNIRNENNKRLNVSKLDDFALFRDQEALTFFIGNDFIKPIFFCPSTLRDSQNHIQAAYRQALTETHGKMSLIGFDSRKNKWGFQLRVLVSLLSYLASNEVRLMRDYVENLQRKKQRRNQDEKPSFDEWITHLDFTNPEHPWSPVMNPLLSKLLKITKQNHAKRFDEIQLDAMHLTIHPFMPVMPNPQDYFATLQFNIEYYMNHAPPSWRGSVDPPIAPFPSQLLRWLMEQPNILQSSYLHDVIELETVWKNYSKTPYSPLENYVSVIPDVPQFHGKQVIPVNMWKSWNQWWGKRNWASSLEPKDVLKPPCDVGTAGKWEHKTLLFHLPEWEIDAREKMLKKVKLSDTENERNQILDLFRF